MRELRVYADAARFGLSEAVDTWRRLKRSGVTTARLRQAAASGLIAARLHLRLWRVITGARGGWVLK